MFNKTKLLFFVVNVFSRNSGMANLGNNVVGFKQSTEIKNPVNKN